MAEDRPDPEPDDPGAAPEASPVRSPTLDLPVSTAEALFAPATVRMFGRPFTGLILGELGLGPSTHHSLARQLREAAASDDADLQASLARIYGISYQGEYYKMPSPPVMLVFGRPIDVPPGFMDQIGTAGFEFSQGTFVGGVKMWTVDELDYGVRIDVSIGWIADILLAEAMGDCGDDADAPDMSGRALQSKASSKLTSKLASKLVQR